MSRVYWHSKYRTAELRGSERAWLGHVARGPADAAWDFDPVGSSTMDRIALLLGMVPPESEESYLHRYLREAQEENERHRAAIAANRLGTYNPEPRQRLVQAVSTALRVNGFPLTVAGVQLDTSNVELNTALVAGSDPVRLAAKIHGWCETHCYVEGPDRKWLADIIDEGLRAGIYRRGLWWVDRPCDGPAENEPDRQWSDQGWGDVLDLLRESDDGPVVLSYSVTDSFPNREVAGWEPPPMPDGWVPNWADTDEGLAEWEQDYPTAEDKAAYYEERAGDAWYDLHWDEQWDTALAGLRRDLPWARLGPDTLTEVTFHYPVTVYDLFAPDRDERIRAALASEESE